MAQNYMNGEWYDDEQDQSNPLAGLNSPQSPNKTQTQFSDAYKAYENPDWQKGVNTMGLNANWDQLKQIGQENNISPEDWSKSYQYYNDNITPFSNSNWWGQEAQNRVPLQAYAAMNPNANFDYSRYLNPELEKSQQKFKADEEMAKQRKSGGDLFDSLLPLLMVGGLGLATGGFGFGAGAGAFAGADTAAGLSAADALIGAGGAEAATGGIYGASGLGASSPVWSSVGGGLTADNAVMAGFGSGVAGSGASAGDWAGDFGGGGEIPTTPTTPSPNLSNLFEASPGYDAEWGVNFRGDPGANTMFGTPEASANNLQQALNSNITPSQQAALNEMGDPSRMSYSSTRVGDGPLSGFNPEASTSIDEVAKAGLDGTQGAPIVDKSVEAGLGDSLRLGGQRLQDIMRNPLFQLGKTGLNFYQQSQRTQALKDLYSKLEQKSDVGAPFRDMLMRSYSDPNFFKSMPEFQANMDAFNQQYGANAAKNGQRSQLGGAAHNIAVNREGARLGDLFRSRLATAAGNPDTRGMATAGTALAGQQGTPWASLADPALWESMSRMPQAVAGMRTGLSDLFGG